MSIRHRHRGLRGTRAIGAGLAFLAAASPALLLAAEHGAGPGPGHEKPIIQPIVWALLSFLIVLVVLLKKLFPPILAAMDRRAAEIRDALSAAEKARAEAQAMLERHHADMETARKDAAAIIEEGKADALRLKDAIMASARKEAEEISARALREIQRAKLSALEELKKRSVDLSIEIARDLIGRELDPRAHQDLIQDRVRGLAAAP